MIAEVKNTTERLEDKLEKIFRKWNKNKIWTIGEKIRKLEDQSGRFNIQESDILK